MNRISPVLFLTLASSMLLNGQTSFAQSQSTDMAPGPIAELLPKFGTPSKGGLGLLGNSAEPNRLPVSDGRLQVLQTNALPPTTSQASKPVVPVGNPLPLFDTPAQPRSTGSLITSAPPEMPSAAMSIHRTPGSFFPGSTPVSTSQFGTGQEVVYSDASDVASPTLAAQSCDCQLAKTVSEGDCGCDTCAEGDFSSTGECDTCNSDDEVFYVDVDEAGCENFDDCNSAECSHSDGEFYDTGAEPIDGDSSRKSNRRRGKKAIFGRHRTKHLAKKEARSNRNQDEERYEVGQDDTYRSYEEQTYDIADEAATPAVVPFDDGQRSNSSINTTIGVSGLYFNRNYGDDRQFSSSQFPDERGLFANDADHGNFGGFDVNLIRRKANGHGFEARFFQLEPSRATATLGEGPITTLSGGGLFGAANYLSGVGLTGGGVGDVTAADIFNSAQEHQVARETSLQNVEFNFLQLGRTRQRNRGDARKVSHEHLIGFRYLRFDESVNYNAQVFRPGNPASGLLRTDYLNEVTNTLFGIQIGGRTEIGFLKRFSLIAGVKAGIFNNNFTNNQNVSFSARGGDTFSAEILDGPNRGQAFDTEGEDSEVTMIGEFDLGITYQMSNNSRLRVGYRALFVSDVAFAVSQTETLFTDLNAVQSPTANDDLFLQGGYFGAEFAF